MIAIVDTGALYATVDASDVDHSRSLAVFQRTDLDLVIPALVLAETTYLVAARLGAKVEAQFLRSLAKYEVEAPTPDDWPRIGDLVERYADFPLGGTDASVAVLADRLGTILLVTLDHTHFAAVRSQTGQPYRLLPE